MIFSKFSLCVIIFLKVVSIRLDTSHAPSLFQVPLPLSRSIRLDWAMLEPILNQSDFRVRLIDYGKNLRIYSIIKYSQKGEI